MLHEERRNTEVCMCVNGDYLKIEYRFFAFEGFVTFVEAVQ